IEKQEVPNEQENVIAVLAARGHEAADRIIVFDAHTDTVPADDWADRAFSPRLDSGTLYGRGACDTKGSLAAMMIALERVSHTPDRPNAIVLVASADEEVDRTGVRTYL